MVFVICYTIYITLHHYFILLSYSSNKINYSRYKAYLTNKTNSEVLIFLLKVFGMG